MSEDTTTRKGAWDITKHCPIDLRVRKIREIGSIDDSNHREDDNDDEFVVFHECVISNSINNNCTIMNMITDTTQNK